MGKGSKRDVCSGKIEYEVHVNEAVDLTFHLFSHMNIGKRADSVYDPIYTRDIGRKKYLEKYLGIMNLEGELSASGITAHAKASQSFTGLSFFCFRFDDAPGLLRALKLLCSAPDSPTPPEAAQDSYLVSLLHYYRNNIFSAEDLKMIDTFVEIAEREYNLFYKDYWVSRTPDFHRMADLFADTLEMVLDSARKDGDGTSELDRIFSCHGCSRWKIVLSESLNKNGRSLRLQDGTLCSAAKLPGSLSEIATSLISILHENVHPLSDHIVNHYAGTLYPFRSTKAGDIGYVFHLLYEDACQIMLYYILKKSGVVVFKCFFPYKYDEEQFLTAFNLLSRKYTSYLEGFNGSKKMQDELQTAFEIVRESRINKIAQAIKMIVHNQLTREEVYNTIKADA